MAIDKFDGRWRFLSNFHPAKIVDRGITYPSTEHYYVAMKINKPQYIRYGGLLKYYDVIDARELVSTVPTSGRVKRLGQSISVRSDWDDIKLKVMEFALRQKFKDEDLKQMLIDTGSEELIEGNTWHDNFWGICSCSKCGKGQNNLGKLLMKIREEFRNGFEI